MIIETWYKGLAPPENYPGFVMVWRIEGSIPVGETTEMVRRLGDAHGGSPLDRTMAERKFSGLPAFVVATRRKRVSRQG
jgi:hypothetical protein